MRSTVLVSTSKNLVLSPNITDCNMDYRHKMIVPTTQKYKNEDDDDEDLEALRLAALKSRRAKPAPVAKPQLPCQQNIYTGPSQFGFYNQRFGRREYYHHPNRPPRQNGNVYHPSRVNQNLIEIIPVDESALSAISENKTTSDPLSATDATEASKFERYTDDLSGSDEEDLKDPKNPDPPVEDKKPPQDEETGTDKENQSNDGNSPGRDEETELLEDPEEEPEEDAKDPEDDDDILLMADIEEENSLERLMDEMEREMNIDKFPTEKKEKKSSKKDPKEPKKVRDSSKPKNHSNEKLDSLGSSKNDRRSVSPYANPKPMRHRSLSPKQKPRKKSPRRSPQRQIKKSQRDLKEPLRLRSPRKSPPRYSPHPRSRSPRMSPRRSPNRSPIRRLSPRGRSSLSRSPRPRRSRSPKILSRPHSPRFTNRTKSPMVIRMSPGRSPLPRSPKQSPHRLSPIRRVSPRRSRSRSPRRSPRLSPRRSPRLSPRRSPRLSPRRSPWSSPKNSPRLSPRRRRSPKERKRRSLTPEDSSLHRKENSPLRKNIQSSPEISKKVKPVKETIEMSSDPVLEARRRKFESTRPIDPITANKKIKLSKKDAIKIETSDVQVNSSKIKVREIIEEYEKIPDEELSIHENYDFDDLESVLSDESSGPVMCVEVAPVKLEKERVKKKKKKDKEIYQVGKMKDAALAGRIVKEKKCKKKKEVTPQALEGERETVEEQVDEEADLRTELSRRRAERLNRTVPIQSARLLQSAFKGVVNEVAKAKNNAKVIQRPLVKAEEKSSQKEIRRVTVLHRTVPDLSDSEDTLDSKMPVRFRLGTNNAVQETRESKTSRKSSKRQGRKVKHKNLSVDDIDRQK